jgi:hypothetical protein
VLREYRGDRQADARRGAEELVRAGWHTGPIPYGYRAQRVRTTPPGRRPRDRVRLILEPVEAATVRMIFAWRVEDGLTHQEIQHRLTHARYPAPLNGDAGEPGAWTRRHIAAILHNPKYLGQQVWGRHRHGQPVQADRWVWSGPWAHPPIVDEATFTAAQSAQRGASVAADGDKQTRRMP